MVIQINGRTYSVEVMSSPEERKKGMMGRSNLDGCMYFELPKGPHSFWMKDCLIPLDIIFISNGRINQIHKNCQPHTDPKSKPFSYSGFGDGVLEFNANESDNFKIGDLIKFI